LPGSDDARGGRERRTHDRRQGQRRGLERRSGRDRRGEAGWETLPLDELPAVQGNEAALVAAAIDARTRARASFSGFAVGAVLETTSGAIIGGCNVENATYGLTMCAERVALYKALSDGHDGFRRVVVVADTSDPTPPCGSCRQLLWEYCGDIDVVLANLSDVTRRLRLSQLLPLPFDARLLK
jgi:cytidine deaminase